MFDTLLELFSLRMDLIKILCLFVFKASGKLIYFYQNFFRYRTEGNNVNLDLGSPNASNSFPSTSYRGTSFKFNESQNVEPAANSQPQSSSAPSFNYVPDKVAPKNGAFSSLDDKNMKAVDNKYFKFDDDFE